MMIEFAALQLSREELKEIHQALLQRAMVESEMRRERGLEKPEQFPLLERFETLLGEKALEIDKTESGLETELWEFAWYAFTDEWAWYRAAQEVEKELKDSHQDLPEVEAKKLIESRYKKNFKKYVAEVDMREQRAKSLKIVK